MTATRPRLSAAEIAAAREGADLAALIGATVALARHGAEFIGRCPFHQERTPSFTVAAGKGFYKCFGCGAKGSAIDWVMHARGVGFREAVALLLAGQGVGSAAEMGGVAPPKPRGAGADAAARARRVAAARRLWTAAMPVARGDPVWCYLRGRGCLIEPVPAVLRFHPALPHPAFIDPATRRPQRTWPAMIARVDSPSGAFVGIHRTYLAAVGPGRVAQDGELRARKLAKLSLGPLLGGAIRLAGVTAVVGVAEGIEDALSARCLFGLPVWSCLDNGKLAGVQLPAALREVVIFADRDRPQIAPGRTRAPEGVGLRAARRLAERLRAEGRRAKILLPAVGWHDFNDQLAARQDQLAPNAAARSTD